MNDEWAELGGAWRAVEPDAPPDLSPRVLEARSRKFARTIAWRNAREWIASVVVAGIELVALFRRHGVVERLPAIALLLAIVWVSLHLWRHGRNLAPPSPLASTSEFIANEKAALERQRVLLSGVRGWYVAPITLAILFGFVVRVVLGELRLPGFAIDVAIVVAVAVGVDRLNARAARELAVRIRKLDG